MRLRNSRKPRGATRMAAVLLCVVGLPTFGAALAQDDAAAAKGDFGAARSAPGSLVVLKLPELPLFDEARAISAEDQLTLTVERAESGRLLLASRDKLIRGWIYDDEVVPLDGAIDYFSQALIRERSNPEDYWVLGRLWSYRNDNVRALVFLKRAIGRYSDQPHFFLSRGLAYLRTGKLREALEDCERAVRLDPESSKARLVRHQAGHAAIDRSGAIAVVDQAFRDDPTDPTGPKGSSAPIADEHEQASVDEVEEAALEGHARLGRFRGPRPSFWPAASAGLTNRSMTKRSATMMRP